MGLGSEVINLSSFSLSKNEIEFLSLGLGFIEAPEFEKDSKYKDELVNDAHQFTRKLAITDFFHSRKGKKSVKKSKFKSKSSWEPNVACLREATKSAINEIEKTAKNLEIKKEKTNLPSRLLAAKRHLIKNDFIVIKKADKGSAIVVMDIQDYIDEAMRQLSDRKYYRKISKPEFPKNSVKIQKILRDLDKKFLSDKEKAYLTPDLNPRPRCLYLLPKVHKTMDKWSKPGIMPPGRPIVSDCSSESYHISEYIDSFLQPLASKHPSFLKDTQDFLEKIRRQCVNSNSFLVSMDIDSLYTNIDNTSGLLAVKKAFLKYPAENRPDNALLDLLKISLEGNDFEFNNEIFLQIHGTAMGKKFAPSYANIFVADWEERALEKCPLKPECFWRFLDDIFCVWNHSKKEFFEFVEILNSVDPSIRVKVEIHEKEMNFLDTTIYKGNLFNHCNILDSKVYSKPTDTHQLLHTNSFHPPHTFKGIIKSQILRYRQICNNVEDFNCAYKILETALRKRGYNRSKMRKIKQEVLDNSVAPTTPISDTFSLNCSIKRCATCKFVKNETTFKSSSTNLSYISPADTDCGSRNVIYLVTCKICQKQYVGQTGRTLRERFSRHKTSILCGTPNTLWEHFSLHGGLQSVQIQPIEKLQGDLDFRLERERFWIKLLKTAQPSGLNKMLDSLIAFSVRFSSTAKLLTNLVHAHYSKLQEQLPGIFPMRMVKAFKRSKNLKEFLTKSRFGKAKKQIDMLGTQIPKIQKQNYQKSLSITLDKRLHCATQNSSAELAVINSSLRNLATKKATWDLSSRKFQEPDLKIIYINDPNICTIKAV